MGENKIVIFLSRMQSIVTVVSLNAGSRVKQNVSSVRRGRAHLAGAVSA
jgi:hypothetical protein